MENNYLERRINTEKRVLQQDRLIKINKVKQENLFDELKKVVMFAHYDFLGVQSFPGRDTVIREYNCKHCYSTISELHLVDHIVNNHYDEGLKQLRK